MADVEILCCTALRQGAVEDANFEGTPDKAPDS
jgi:hypothetical protein